MVLDWLMSRDMERVKVTIDHRHFNFVLLTKFPIDTVDLLLRLDNPTVGLSS